MPSMTCRPTSAYLALVVAMAAMACADDSAEPPEPAEERSLGLDGRPPNPSCRGSADFPERLSEHPCFVGEPPVVSPALVPYDVASPLWSDGADKLRHLALPDGEAMAVLRDGTFELPEEGVLVKEFSLEGRRLETRLLVRDSGGEWHAATYVWDEDQGDALLEVFGVDVELSDGGTWSVPSAEQCFECHTEAAGISLGLSQRQMALELEYPSTGRTADQIRTLAGVGLLTGESDDAPLVSPADEDASLEARARSYLHANCAHCHRPGGLGEGEIDLRVTTPFRLTKTCNEQVLRGDPIGETGEDSDGGGPPVDEPGLILVPGQPEMSALYARITSDDSSWRMPPVGTRRADPLGSELIFDWIDSLDSCDE